MSEYHELIGPGDIEKVNTHKTSDYDTTIYLDVANIYKIKNIAWGTILKEINERYFG